MKLSVHLLIICLLDVVSSKDLDQDLTLDELVALHGFVLQAFTLKTEDGYILTMHRVVPEGPFNQEEYSQTRKPVIVQHGLLGSSADFFINSPFLEPSTDDGSTMCSDNFGFCLLLTGRYDIWLPNSRGNGFSNGHESLPTSSKEYWAFSFDQMAVYDTPAAIDFILNFTGYRKISFIGFSQGATIGFALLSLKPDYAQILEPFISWAPPVFIGHMSSFSRRLYFLVTLLQRQGGRFDPSTKLAASAYEGLCGIPLIGRPPCWELLDLIMGQTNNLNRTRLPVYFSYFPSTVSNWGVVHFAQMYKTRNFTRFDYGSPKKNWQVYGQPVAPLYPLENITPEAKIAIIYGNSDAFVVRQDVKRLFETLRNNEINFVQYQVQSKLWNHLDFIMGKGAGALVYDQTIQILDYF